MIRSKIPDQYQDKDQDQNKGQYSHVSRGCWSWKMLTHEFIDYQVQLIVSYPEENFTESEG